MQSLTPPGGWNRADEAEGNERENRAKENDDDQDGLRRDWKRKWRTNVSASVT
jgi:hypothetical protein